MKRHLAASLMALTLACTRAPPQDASSPSPAGAVSSSNAVDDIARVRAALPHYERIRTALASDTLAGVADAGAAMASVLEERLTREHQPPRDEPEEGRKGGVHGLLQLSRERARTVARAPTLEDARAAFGMLSDAFIALLMAVPDAASQLHAFSCPMTTGFGGWVQTEPEIENPYMGRVMLRCGSTLPLAELHPPASVMPHGDDQAVDHYTCPMHPSVRQEGAGTCPLCGMDLVAVTRGQVRSGAFLIDEPRRRAAGIRTERVATSSLLQQTRRSGRVTVDDRRIQDVTLRTGGYVEELLVAEEGVEVRKGQLLLRVYSPELYAAQQEFLEALRLAKAGGARSLEQASRARLRLLGMSPAQIDALAVRGTAEERVSVLSPGSGVITHKGVVLGARVREGGVLYRITPFESVWIEAELWNDDFANIDVGTRARVVSTSIESARSEAGGTVSFMAPAVDPRRNARTARIELANPERRWLPGMAVDVWFERELDKRLHVPASAVVYTGFQHLVFVDEGAGLLQPVVVAVGERVGDRIVIREGLAADASVVVAGTFLVAAESRLGDALGLWSARGANANEASAGHIHLHEAGGEP